MSNDNTNYGEKRTVGYKEWQAKSWHATLSGMVRKDLTEEGAFEAVLDEWEFVMGSLGKNILGRENKK